MDPGAALAIDAMSDEKCAYTKVYLDVPLNVQSVVEEVRRRVVSSIGLGEEVGIEVEDETECVHLNTYVGRIRLRKRGSGRKFQMFEFGVTDLEHGARGGKKGRRKEGTRHMCFWATNACHLTVTK